MTDVVASNEDNRQLQLAQNLRERVVTAMTAKGIPEDRADREFLMRAVDGLASSALSNKKIKADAAVAHNQAQTAQTIAKILLQYNPNKQVSEAVDVTAIPIDMARPVIEGDTAEGTIPVPYDSIMTGSPEE